MPPHGDPVAELILTVLSQSTNDRNRDVAYLRLRQRFASWEAVMEAPRADVEEALRPGGIAKVKSARIQAILRALAERELSLQWLAQAPVQEGRDYLTSLPGVGRKTAACVLLFAYGLRDVPVDTHVSRVGTRLGTWQAVRDAPLAEVEEAIRPGGISKVKSARIQAILAAISTGAGAPAWARRGQALSLDSRSGALRWLARVPVEQARDYLTSLPGVGRKTAACVLLFAYGLRDVPVDTHVSRVGMRLGLLQAGAPFEQLHDQMLALTPPGDELELHVNLLRHGRRTCHARGPDCGNCGLARMCPSRALLSPAAAPRRR